MTENMGDITLQWRNAGPPLCDERLDEIENHFKIRFPSDFRECIRQYHEGSPSKKEFVVHSSMGDFTSVFAFLLSFSKENDDNIEVVISDLEDIIEEGIIPFAEDGGGDFICLDFRESLGAPSIIYWHRTGLPENQLIYLAPSFSSFLKMLK